MQINFTKREGGCNRERRSARRSLIVQRVVVRLLDIPSVSRSPKEASVIALFATVKRGRKEDSGGADLNNNVGGWDFLRAACPIPPYMARQDQINSGREGPHLAPSLISLRKRHFIPYSNQFKAALNTDRPARGLNILGPAIIIQKDFGRAYNKGIEEGTSGGRGTPLRRSRPSFLRAPPTGNN